MSLPIPFLRKKEAEEYILVLLLRQEKTIAAIINQHDKRSTIVGKHEEYFPSTLQNTTDEDFLAILDKVISRAEETLPPSVATKKTIFGVPASWVEEKHITKEYLHKLKKASDSLSLTPIGFIEIPEAIVHLLQEEEGAPISAILAEIGKKYISLSVVRGGKIILTKQIELIDTPAKTIDTLLQTFTNVEVFPSRIIAFDGDHDQRLTQSLIAHQWSKSLPFLHVPQITILPKDFDVNAMIFGAASQMGLDALPMVKEVREEIKSFSKETGPETSTEEKPSHSLHPVDVPTVPSPQTSSLEQFGFIREKDIALQEKPHVVKKDNDTDLIHNKKTPKDEEELEEGENDSNLSMNVRADSFIVPEERTTHVPPKRLKIQFSSFLLPVRSAFQNLLQKKPDSKVLIVLPVILIFLFGLLFAYINLLKATITVTVTPKLIEKKEEIVFATEGGNDFQNKIISAKTSAITLSGTTTTQATGKKETGTKAKGAVTIFNSEQAKRTLPSGTTITSANNLTFTLDKDISIASATGDIFSGVKSGTAQVEVSAKQIGSEYNLPSNTKFTVGDSQSLAARNDQAFSGGSKKQVTVVAKADVDKLVATLPKSLEQKARDEFSKKLSQTETLLTVLPDLKPSKKDFSNNVDEEAKSVKLTSSVNFEGVLYDNTDLVAFSKQLIKTEFDQDMTVSDNEIQNILREITQDDENEIGATLLIRASLLPNINEEKLKKDVAGKTFDQTKKILAAFPQVENVTISLSPPLPFLPSLLPRIHDNISLQIQSRNE